jgi:uncharacterized MAPEG superfamily protein
MAVPYLCILAAYALVYLPRFVFVTPAMVKQGYDNAEPREQQKSVGGVARRGLAAHQNGFETFAPFVAGVLMAQAAGVAAETVTQWSVAFVASRVVYVAAYALGWHALRSVAWGVSVTAIVMLMVAGV